MGIKESTCDEHWLLYGSAESLYGTPETNITLHVNYARIQKETIEADPQMSWILKLDEVF